MKTSDDDFLLFDESEDIDLFGDFDDVGNGNEQTSDEDLDIDPELILKSVQEFHNLFAGHDEALGVGSGAILLYQHLQAAGYKANVAVEDKEATVTAGSSNQALKHALIDRVEDLLDEMIYMVKDWKSDNFTVHSIVTHTEGDFFNVAINFKAV